MNQELQQIKNKDIPNIRHKILEKQEGLCKLCDEPINEISGYSLDHQHMTKAETIGEDGAGLVRGVLCRACNVMEGKIWNSQRRYLQPRNVQERIEWLESLIEYYKEDNYNVIHPSEIPKEPTVSKKNYNKLKKLYDGKAKFPDYPKSKKLTKRLKELFEDYEIPPYN